MIKIKKLKISISLVILISLLAFNFAPYLIGGTGFVSAVDIITEEEEREMEVQIKELEDKISRYRTEIIANQQKARTLETEIAIFNGEINRTELEIQKISLVVSSLNAKIAGKEESIRQIERQVDLEKTALSELIREISKYDDVSFLEIILGRDQLSDFLSELRSLENFQTQIQITLKEIYVLKKDLEEQKTALNEEKQEQIDLRFVQEAQRVSLQLKKNEKENLLTQTKGQENLFSQLVSRTEKDIEVIKNRLYFLKGIISDGELRFEDAYKFARFASIYTGIRPAFLLAILSRESGLGQNIGKGSWRVDMKPSQRKYYLEICNKLGISPDTYPVSKKVWYGWGGAMGPAQFMPATWLGYEARITEITGNNPPSPWNVKDAFVASALYLVNKGANQQTYYTEWKSAMIYLAGSRWNLSYLAFYGDQVMALATQFQREIDILEQE